MACGPDISGPYGLNCHSEGALRPWESQLVPGTRPQMRLPRRGRCPLLAMTDPGRMVFPSTPTNPKSIRSGPDISGPYGHKCSVFYTIFGGLSSFGESGNDGFSVFRKSASKTVASPGCAHSFSPPWVSGPGDFESVPGLGPGHGNLFQHLQEQIPPGQPGHRGFRHHGNF